MPKTPKEDELYVDRLWRLSFQSQEREIIKNRCWMKPTIRLFKVIFFLNSDIKKVKNYNSVQIVVLKNTSGALKTFFRVFLYLKNVL